MILQAILIGIVEGLTEFLPISSTGHILIAERAIGYHDAAEIFTVVIQVGAVAAVLWHYRRDLWAKFTGIGRPSTRRFWQNWIIATIPAGIAGLLLEKSLNKLATLGVVSVALILGGIAMLLIETYHHPKAAAPEPRLEKLTIKQSMQVGLYQVLSLVPGVSRSGATIMGGLLSGLDRTTATAFSFYLSIPILVLASGYKIFKGRHDLASVDGGSTALIAGTLATFVVALLMVSWLLRYIAKHDFKIFAYYRIALGILILAVLAIR